MVLNQPSLTNLNQPTNQPAAARRWKRSFRALEGELRLDLIHGRVVRAAPPSERRRARSSGSRLVPSNADHPMAGYNKH